ncbi:MAG TPA: ribosome maturation factor RimM [Solirubrobacteraceae bacterium]|nr:ribosome maturation factor RimM [Solirubrobacteraceae bacterium]
MSGRGLLLAGRVGSPHGLDGSFHVAQPTPQLLVDGVVLTIDGRAYAVNRRAGHDARIILRLAGVTDREGALALRGQALMAPRELAPELGEDEWWAEDLEACRVVDGDREVGAVTRLMGLPSCEVLEVARPGIANPLLVPLVGDAVRSVDVDAKVIDVDLAFLGEA